MSGQSDLRMTDEVLTAITSTLRALAVRFGTTTIPADERPTDQRSWEIGQAQGHADAEAALLSLAEKLESYGRAAILDWLVQDAARHNLYELTAEPRETR
ncbi:MAG: hypothetical protein JWO67_3333 [Streptosporangiaceae bacterium]|nr:hypothetical protein [Streptosporangiaceae bacterium]